jgi:hypothetical protein
MKWLTDEKDEVKSVLRGEKQGAEDFQWLLFLTNPEQLREYFVHENAIKKELNPKSKVPSFTDPKHLGERMKHLWELYHLYRKNPGSIDAKKQHRVKLFQAMKETMERGVTMGIQWPGDSFPHFGHFWKAIKHIDVGFTDGHLQLDRTMGIQWPGDSFPHFGHFWKAIKHIDVGFTDGHLQLDRNSLVFYSSAASATSNVTQAGGSV